MLKILSLVVALLVSLPLPAWCCMCNTKETRLERVKARKAAFVVTVTANKNSEATLKVTEVFHSEVPATLRVTGESHSSCDWGSDDFEVGHSYLVATDYGKLANGTLKIVVCDVLLDTVHAKDELVQLRSGKSKPARNAKE